MPRYDVAIGTVMLLSITGIALPGLTFWMLLLIGGTATWAVCSRRHKRLPLKMPLYSGANKDYANPLPGSLGYGPAEGTIPLGNIIRDKKELWISPQDALTHMLVLGVTGAGKTENLLSLVASSAFMTGGGCAYIDAKAGKDLVKQSYTFAKLFGRTQDMRILNFETGSKEITGTNFKRYSNTAAPFSRTSASMIVQTLVALIGAGGNEGGGNKVFSDRAIAILEAVLPALVELREKGIINIYPDILSKYVRLDQIIWLVNSQETGALILEDGTQVDYQLSDRVCDPIRNYLRSLPGYEAGQPGDKQPEQTRMQHGYGEGYFSRTLTTLSGTFGHIYQAEKGEVDFVDVITHGRLLFVNIPSIALAKEQAENLGKLTLSSIKSAIAANLGDNVEGTISEVIESLPIDKKRPFTLIIDEMSAISVPGFSTVACQSRSLGIASIFSMQSIAGLKKVDENEAMEIFGNTTTKILGKLSDAETTFEWFRKLAGQMEVAEGSGFEKNEFGISNYKKQSSASIKSVDKINIDDLKSQGLGEVHIFHDSDVHRANMFYHGLSDSDYLQEWRLNRLITVPAMTPEEIELERLSVERNERLRRTLHGEAIPGQEALSSKSLTHCVSTRIYEETEGYLYEDDYPWLMLALLDEAMADPSALVPAPPTQDSVTRTPGGAACPQPISLDATIEAASNSTPGTDTPSSTTGEDAAIKTPADSHWIFGTDAGTRTLGTYTEFQQSLMELYELAGYDEAAASSAAAETAEFISSEMGAIYPSAGLVGTTQLDHDLIFESMRSMDSDD